MQVKETKELATGPLKQALSSRSHCRCSGANCACHYPLDPRPAARSAPHAVHFLRKAAPAQLKCAP